MVSALQVELTEGDQALLASRGTENIKAWQLTYEAVVLVLAHRQDSVRRGIELLEEAVRLDDSYTLAWYPYGIAICYWMLGKLDDAFTSIEEAVRIDPGLSLNYFVLVLLYTETEQPQKAKECIEKIYRADPNFSASAFIESLPFGDPKVEKRRADLLRKAGMLD